MSKIDLKPCPFCGGKACIYGAEIKEFIDGSWADKSRKEYWIRPFCRINCILGNSFSRAFGAVDGIRYTSSEAAAKAWNRRVGKEAQE